MSDQALEELKTNGADPNLAYIVTAAYYFHDDKGNRGLKYFTNANVRQQGGLPVAFSDEDVKVEDGFIPPHWILAQQVDKYQRHKTIITYPDWANDPEYYERMDDNEKDNMAAVNKYGVELKGLVEHYQHSYGGSVCLEPYFHNDSENN